MDTPRKILNVEDIKENRELIRRILESQGYEVFEAVNALEGIEKAQQLRPDLILMDINLPDLDGFTAVTRIRGVEPLKHVPIIAVTARNVSDDRQRARAIGCDSYISKPVDFDELVNEVARYIERGHKAEEPTTIREQYLEEQSRNLIGQLEKKISEIQVAYEHVKHLDEAKTNFISVVSHELRTPLTVIHSYTQMLQSLPAIKDDPSASEMLAGLANGVARMKEITNDLVNVIRFELASEDVEFAPVSIRSVLNAVEREYQSVFEERGLRFAINIAKNLPMVSGDSQQLQSALSRVIGNAIKYTPDGGEISLTAFPVERPNQDSPAFVEIIISDTGVGIDVDKQNLIFEKFATAENVALHSTSKTKFMGGGAGLGLTIAKGVVELHNGRIWVESRGFDPENLPGSKFFIILPAL